MQLKKGKKLVIVIVAEVVCTENLLFMDLFSTDASNELVRVYFIMLCAWIHFTISQDMLILKARTICDKSTFVEDLASGMIPTKLYGK